MPRFDRNRQEIARQTRPHVPVQPALEGILHAGLRLCRQQLQPTLRPRLYKDIDITCHTATGDWLALSPNYRDLGHLESKPVDLCEQNPMSYRCR
jgi:hypothetical protein